VAQPLQGIAKGSFHIHVGRRILQADIELYQLRGQARCDAHQSNLCPHQVRSSNGTRQAACRRRVDDRHVAEVKQHELRIVLHNASEQLGQQSLTKGCVEFTGYWQGDRAPE